MKPVLWVTGELQVKSGYQFIYENIGETDNATAQINSIAQ